MAEVAKKDTFSDPWVADETRLLIGKGAAHQSLNLKYANRHGLIAGATGTGKTVTLQVLAEGFSRAGVPVFVADIKGDLSGISQAGKPHPKVDERVEKIGITDFTFNPTPTICWDVYGEQGHPIRITISEMGPLLLSRLMDLSDAQTGVLNIAFAYADDEGMLLLDLKDLRSLLTFIGENAKEISTTYGLVSTSSVGAIQRRLLELEQQGAEQFFGEPALKIEDIMRTDANGQGYINLLAADKLVNSPKLYSTFLLWLLSELFETLPEVGDPDKPTLVFFFDEAHLLFDEAPKVLIDKVEQVVRLIRSKGVGVYFITQSPQDVPVEVLGQLGNKIQHALRAFTPKDKKAVKVAAESFRENPELDTVTAITELGVGEALVSTLQKDGIPSVVDRTLIRPPCSRIGPASKGERIDILDASPLKGTYNQTVDRESAYEVLNKRTTEMAKQAEQKQKEEQLERERRTQEKEDSRPSEWERMGVSLTKYMARYAVQTLGRRVVRGVLGSILK